MDIDPQQFRSALGSFATGVTIVTTRDAQGHDVGLTANSFNSVSLQPPMVLWSLAKTSASLPAFAAATHFAVHVLAADQEHLSRAFAQKGANKFSGVKLDRGPGEIPLIANCSAQFQCRMAFQYEGGDHIIFVGEVVSFEHSAYPPLVFHAGNYAVAARKSAEAVAISGSDFHHGDLSHLLARAYFQMLSPVRHALREHQLTIADHYLMSVLMVSGGQSLDEVNEIIDYTGFRVTGEALNELCRRGLVRTAASDQPAQELSLTEEGRQILLEMIAAAKALEADAQSDFNSEESRLLKLLLQRLLAGTTAHGDIRVARHMELMRTMVHGAQKES